MKITRNIAYGTIALVIVAIIVILSYTDNFAGNQKGDGEKVKIGVIMPFSGELAVFGDSARQGIETALIQSGADKDSVEILYEDTEGFSTQGALSAFKKLVEQDNARIIIGPFGPAQVLTVAPDTKKYGDLTIIGMSNCDDRFKEYASIFCIYPGIEEQVNFTLEKMQNAGLENVYLFTEQSEFGLLVENILQERQDTNFIGSEKVVAGQTKDFRTLIAKAVSKRPDVIYAMFAPNEGFVMLRQYPALSKDIPLYIGTDVTVEQLKGIFENEAQNITFVARISEEYNADFSKLYMEMYEQNPDYFAALAHSVATIVLEALKEGFDYKILRSKMTGSAQEKTAIKNFYFKSDRTASMPLYNYAFKDRELKIIE
ncbi:ABC transporter substrate-binding protein [Candidatus Kaiserbacteria bacterium]|nr:ABC transporter substrate-binding protein [Candidatus Kaiserbacteria bacterium]